MHRTIHHCHDSLSLTAERPIALKTLAGDTVTLVTQGQRYIFTKCLAPAMNVSTYENSVVRSQTVSGHTAEYFRPGALPCELFVQPGDLMEILEIDEEHGFIHATITIIRGQIYVLDRVISLREGPSNPQDFIVAPHLSNDGMAIEIDSPIDPLIDETPQELLIQKHVLSEALSN